MSYRKPFFCRIESSSILLYSQSVRKCSDTLRDESSYNRKPIRKYWDKQSHIAFASFRLVSDRCFISILNNRENIKCLAKWDRGLKDQGEEKSEKLPGTISVQPTNAIDEDSNYLFFTIQ